MHRNSANKITLARVQPGWLQPPRRWGQPGIISRDQVGSVRRRSRARQLAATAAEVEGTARRDEAIARLEAVLFVAGEPLGSRRLAQLASLADGTLARTLIHRLNRLYDEEESAFRVEEVAGGFQLLTRPQFGPWLRRLHRAAAEVRLSAPALETLAVIAYRQPTSRAEMEAIRGVHCGEILRQLMERDLIRVCGRSEDLGRPFLYATTKRFLQVFGLRHLDDLPRAEILRDALHNLPTHDSE
jgi:segregation and condensation protein B